MQTVTKQKFTFYTSCHGLPLPLNYLPLLNLVDSSQKGNGTCTSTSGSFAQTMQKTLLLPYPQYLSLLPTGRLLPNLLSPLALQHQNVQDVRHNNCMYMYANFIHVTTSLTLLFAELFCVSSAPVHGLVREAARHKTRQTFHRLLPGTRARERSNRKTFTD